MTWEELKEKAKKTGYEIIIGTFGDYTYEKIITKHLFFFRDGTITCPYEYINEDYLPKSDYVVVAERRTPDQMCQIMEALR